MRTEGLLVTGFGPFMNVTENPSGLIAQSLGIDHVMLPVSYQAVDEWLAADPAQFHQTILMLGVCQSPFFRMELFAHNELRGTPDVNGRTPLGSITEGGPRILGATLWDEKLMHSRTANVRTSTDPGRYLCNYIAYKTIERYPDKRVGFLHVPPLEAMPLDQQINVVQRVIRKIT